MNKDREKIRELRDGNVGSRSQNVKNSNEAKATQEPVEGGALEEFAENLITVEIETPCFCFVKRTARGTIDFISPFPCPFDYGFIPGTFGEDGDPCDAIVFGGGRLVRFQRIRGIVFGRVIFTDAGKRDDKLLVWALNAIANGEQRRKLSLFNQLKLFVFFSLYACLKKWLNRYRQKQGKTVFGGIQWFNSDHRGMRGDV